MNARPTRLPTRYAAQTLIGPLIADKSVASNHVEDDGAEVKHILPLHVLSAWGCGHWSFSKSDLTLFVFFLGSSAQTTGLYGRTELDCARVSAILLVFTACFIRISVL